MHTQTHRRASTSHAHTAHTAHTLHTCTEHTLHLQPSPSQATKQRLLISRCLPRFRVPLSYMLISPGGRESEPLCTPYQDQISKPATRLSACVVSVVLWALWFCGSAVLQSCRSAILSFWDSVVLCFRARFCGSAVPWFCGSSGSVVQVVMWCCGSAVLWFCGSVVLRFCRSVLP